EQPRRVRRRVPGGPRRAPRGLVHRANRCRNRQNGRAGRLGAAGQPMADLTVPDASWDAYYAAVACLHTWLGQLVRDVGRVNGPVSAQLLVDDLKARLAELEQTGSLTGR